MAQLVFSEQALSNAPHFLQRLFHTKLCTGACNLISYSILNTQVKNYVFIFNQTATVDI